MTGPASLFTWFRGTRLGPALDPPRYLRGLVGPAWDPPRYLRGFVGPALDLPRYLRDFVGRAWDLPRYLYGCDPFVSTTAICLSNLTA